MTPHESRQMIVNQINRAHSTFVGFDEGVRGLNAFYVHELRAIRNAYVEMEAFTVEARKLLERFTIDERIYFAMCPSEAPDDYTRGINLGNAANRIWETPLKKLARRQ